jgi:hypothetical protein
MAGMVRKAGKCIELGKPVRQQPSDHIRERARRIAAQRQERIAEERKRLAGRRR